jgi:hypothetical protein
MLPRRRGARPASHPRPAATPPRPRARPPPAPAQAVCYAMLCYDMLC